VSASNSAVPEPTHIGRYKIEKKLGAGAFGTVYKAKDPELGRYVAIKTIRLEGLAASQASLDDLLVRFKREATVAAGLGHPNIVRIFDIGSLPGNSFLVLEFIDGVGLDSVIKGSGKMSVERAAAIGLQVAEALDYAWTKEKLGHRDIKPANIMVEPGDRVKVTDFGIAKLMTGDTVDNLTATGSLLGTPSYMSPEQARGQDLDGRSDLFSLGCILYEMVAGQRAFRGDSITALLFKIVAEEPPSLKELDPTVSDAMLHVIGKALSKAKETRYQSGHELAEDLRAIATPGYVPTVRTQDRATRLIPPDAAPADVPTISSPPTAQSPATLGSQPTRVATTPGTVPPPVPPLPPTVVAQPTARATTPPPIPRQETAPAVRPAVAPPARRAGGGAGLIVGLGVVGLLLVALVAGGGYWLLRRNQTATAPATDVPATTLAAAPPTTTAPEAPPTTTAAEATTATSVPAPPPTVPSTPEPRPTRVASNTQPPGRTTPSVTSPPNDQAVSHSAPAGQDFSYLDQVPSEETDGRATGEALAQKYRSGGGSSYTTGHYNARPMVPRGITLEERPAVATLLHLNSVEQAYHRQNGRYGTLHEMHSAGLLVLDTPVDASGFRRRGYSFRLAVESDGFHAEAVPQRLGGRSFVVDDAGKVRVLD
jgi:serine/threonine protein kinase